MSTTDPITTSTGATSSAVTTDGLTARRYTHPALADQPVVRLVPAALGEAEDLALEFLGLARDGDPVEVGRARQEALGFPAWALVHDPANGHHALALVKEMERLARQARSKPGAAKEGFEQLAAELGRTVPHFLPTYLEQVGRIMLDAENQSYAAAFFDKARQAEQVHNLELDEDRLRAVFMEFALSGALTVKALRRYVKDLSARLDGAHAWESFRQLCVERSAAGMPPYAGLAEDTRSLLRRSGLTKEAAAAAERGLLWELLCSPAVGRAPAAFWTSWRDRLIELAGAGAGTGVSDGGPTAGEVRRRLLELLPTPSGESSWRPSRFTPAWLELLAVTGAETLLTGGDEAADGAAQDGAEAGAPAAWLSRWAGHLVAGWGGSQRSAETIALVGRMANRLRGDGVPVALFASVPEHRYAVLLDLLDVLVAAGVPVDLPSELLQRLDLMSWLDDRTPGERDLAGLAADPVLRPVLRRAVGETRYRGNGRPTRPVMTVPVLAELLGEWLDEQVERLGRCQGLAAAEDVLTALASWRAQLTELRPEAADRIAGLDVAALLGRTLRAGIVDELGWPALEKACAIVDGARHPVPGLRGLGVVRPPAGLQGQGRIALAEAWPALIVHRDDQVAVAGPVDVLLVHHPRVAPRRPGHADLRQFCFVDGELLVAWTGQNGRWRGYWSARPDDEFELTGAPDESPWLIDISRVSLPVPDGGRSTGRRRLRAGDTTLPRRRAVWGDGIGYWVLEGDGAWTEFDPVTGARGRASLPPWLAASTRQCELPLETAECQVLPLQPGQDATPLGTDGSLVGRWVRREADRVVLGTPDGRVVRLPADLGHGPVLPIGLLRLPGDAELLLVQHGTNLLEVYRSGGGGRREELLGRFVVSEAGGLFAAGTSVVAPPPFWHNLRPRDEQGSQALRRLTDVQAAELLSAARPREHREGEEKTWLVVAGTRLPRTRAELVPVEEVGRLLPQVTDPLLRAGVAGHVLHAVTLLARAVAFRPAEDGDGARQRRLSVPPRREEQYRPPLGDDYRIRLLTGSSPGYQVTPGTETWTVLHQIRAVAALLAPTGDQRAAGAGSAGAWTVEKHDIGQAHTPWLPLLHQLPDLTLRAVSGTTEPGTRQTLHLLLGELLRLPVTATAGTLREVVLSEEQDAGQPARSGRRGQVLRRGDRTVVIVDQHRWSIGSRSWLALDHDPSGQFGRVGEFATEREHRVEAHRDPALLRALLDRAATDGPAAWRPEAVAALHDGTGAGVGLATVLLSGAPPQGTQALPGLARNEESVAWTRLGQRNRCGVSSVIAAVLPDDPSALWTTGPDVAAGAERWTERFGRRAWLPENLATTVNGADLVTIDALLDAEHTPWLTRTTVQRVVTRSYGNHTTSELTAEDPSALPHGHTAWSGVQNALRWLAYHLPYGDPLRVLLPKALRAVRARLADPGLLLDLHVSYDNKGQATAPALRAVFGAPETGGAGPDGLVRLGDALVLAPQYGREEVRLRPSALSGPQDPVLDLLLGHSGGDPSGFGELQALRWLLDPEADRLVDAGAAVSHTPRPAQDASTSVPGLVREVADARGLGPDAAALYLMLLALPDPMDRRVAAWTGWKPARLRAARAELLAADGLVVEAKRSRAGRSLFLPGGWQESRSPGIPMETWKAGLYLLSAGVARWPARPVPELFELAWRRVREGDAPGYEQPASLTARRTSRKAAR